MAVLFWALGRGRHELPGALVAALESKELASLTIQSKDFSLAFATLCFRT